jgi:undecaprenyl diphosphate synthase
MRERCASTRIKPCRHQQRQRKETKGKRLATMRMATTRTRATSWRDEVEGFASSDDDVDGDADGTREDARTSAGEERRESWTDASASASEPVFAGRGFPSLLNGIRAIPRQAVGRWDSRPGPLRGLEASEVPEHVAVIMDGNARWAARRGLPRSMGHERGVNALRVVVRCCASWNINTLTVFAFSQENWGRDQSEVDELMELVETAMVEELPLLIKEGVRVEVIGDLSQAKESVKSAISHAVEATKDNDALRLVIALSYGGRQDIVQAAKSLARKALSGEISIDDIDEDAIGAHLSTGTAAASASAAASSERSFSQTPDLLVRAGGEQRLSNFLLWDLAYTELYFAPMPWPEFGEAELRRAIHAYARRDRRFGARNAS